MKGLKHIICFIMVGAFLSGCAMMSGKKVEVVTVPTNKKQMVLLAKKYEEAKQFKKALNALKEAQSMDRSDKQIGARVERLEKGLDNAVRQHIKSGERYLKRGDRGKAKKEFLMVLFLDPEQRQALNYLRGLSGVPVPRAPAKKASTPLPVPDVSGDGYTLHTLKKGESLSTLARQYYGDKMLYGIIVDFNNIKDLNKVRVGQKIKIPDIHKKPIKEEKRKAEVPELSTEPVSELAEPVMDESEDEDAVLSEEIQEAERALEYSKEELLEEAKVEETQQTAKLDYKLLELTFNNAETLFEKEKYDDAAAEYQKIIDMKPDHAAALNRLDASEKIASYLKKGQEYFMSRKYGKAYDEFSSVMQLRPDSSIAKEKMDGLVNPMIAEATYLLYDAQSPCEASDLISKILEREPDNKDAKDLMDEADALAEGLELECGNK